MDAKPALATAAGLVLVVAGAASALTSAWTAPAKPATSTAAVTAGTPTVVTEYVDQFGNPVAPPGQVQAENVIMTRSPQAEEIIVYEEPVTVFDDDFAPPTTAAGSTTTVGQGDDDESDHADEHEDEHEDGHEVEDHG